MYGARIYLDKQAVLERMLEQHWTIRDIMDKMAVNSKQAVRYHLSGSRPISMRLAYKFADVFNCKPTDIIKVVAQPEKEGGY